MTNEERQRDYFISTIGESVDSVYTSTIDPFCEVFYCFRAVFKFFKHFYYSTNFYLCLSVLFSCEATTTKFHRDHPPVNFEVGVNAVILRLLVEIILLF